MNIKEVLWHNTSAFGWTLFIIQIIFLIIFGTSVIYDYPVDATRAAEQLLPSVSNPDEYIYNYMKDVNVMMIVGFGFLMTFLKKYGFSSVGYNLMISAVVIQWALIINSTRYTHENDGYLVVGVEAMINALFALCSVLIAFGATLGKMTPLQYLIMAMIQIPILVWNEYLGKDVIHVVDSGDSIFIHGFGAYFGLAVATVMNRKAYRESENNGSTYTSDLFAMIGTLFLWIYWPSFNAGTADGTARPRGITNTMLSLCAATVMCFVTSTFISALEGGEDNKYGKFNMIYVQNSTIAGGVAVGTCNLMMIKPVGALIIGCIAGIFSVLGYRYVTPKMNRIIHDTCGVHNLHGFPSLISAIASSIAAAVASRDLYSDELYYIFPALSPEKGRTYNLKYLTYETSLDYNRTPSLQGGLQIVGWLHTFGIAIVGGLLTGVILRFALFWEKIEEKDAYNDRRDWDLEFEE